MENTEILAIYGTNYKEMTKTFGRRKYGRENPRQGMQNRH